MRKIREQIEHYYILNYARIEYEGRMEFVVFVKCGKPSNRIRQHLDRNTFKYVTTNRCSLHGHTATLQGQNRTARYVDSHKCVKCVDELDLKCDEYGRPYQFQVNNKYFHRIRQVGDYFRIKVSEVNGKVSSDTFPNWHNLFENCK